MKSIASLAASLLAILALQPVAGASTYALLGFGPKAGVGGDLGDAYDGDTRTARFGLGQRIGPVALEGSMFGADLIAPGGRESTTFSLGLDLKGYVSLVGPLELFGKGGLNHTWLVGDDYSGSGWDLGAGVQFTLDLPVGYAAVWVDYTYQNTGLSSDADSAPASSDIDGSLNMVMVGGSLGL